MQLRLKIRQHVVRRGTYRSRAGERIQVPRMRIVVIRSMPLNEPVLL